MEDQVATLEASPPTPQRNTTIMPATPITPHQQTTKLSQYNCMKVVL